MIELSKREYPYPVLSDGRDDYSSDCRYATQINIDEIVVTNEYIEIPASYELSCMSLEEGIKDGQFSAIIKIRSGAASFCQIFKFEDNKRSNVIRIPKYDVAEKIELTGMVVANENISHFSCPEMNHIWEF